MSDAAPNTSPAPAPTGAKSMDDIMALCKRRGFIYQASEIYGGINGFWDYGPLGTMLKRNLREAWWQDMIMNPCWGRKGPNGEVVRCVPVETRIIQHPNVWQASGHIAGFADPMQMCRKCKKLFRADHVQGLLNGAEWYQSLARNYALASTKPEGFTPQDLQDWVNRVGKKAAPGLAIVRNFSVTFSFVRDAILNAAKGSGAPVAAAWSDFVRLLATEQPAATGLQTPCPNCGGDLTEPRPFNLMFQTYTGAVLDEESKVYLRPETAQGIFINFKNVLDTSRVKLPLGIGNVGPSFRNEITPRHATYRSREFEQAELEFFCHPDESQAWYAFWRDFRMEWWKSIGLAGDNLILREHEKDELSHYSTGTSDVEYRFPFTAPGFGELEGIAHRGCFDLTQHAAHSKVKLDYFDTDRGETLPNGAKKGERYVPHCIEPAAGLDRGALALICEAYTKDTSRPSPEILKFHPRMAPIKAAVFPLVNKDGMPEVAEKIHADLLKRFGRQGLIETDAKQSIGKRYARMDEAGCPWCFTIDGDTLTGQTVTVRDRDSGGQQRIAADKVVAYVSERLGE